jgi:hypothetical protein
VDRTAVPRFGPAPFSKFHDPNPCGTEVLLHLRDKGALVDEGSHPCASIVFVCVNRSERDRGMNGPSELPEVRSLGCRLQARWFTCLNPFGYFPVVIPGTFLKGVAPRRLVASASRGCDHRGDPPSGQHFGIPQVAGLSTVGAVPEDDKASPWLVDSAFGNRSTSWSHAVSPRSASQACFRTLGFSVCLPNHANVWFDQLWRSWTPCASTLLDPRSAVASWTAQVLLGRIGAEFLLRRGNSQLSPAVSKGMGSSNVVVATPAKLAQTPLLRFDTGDSILDCGMVARRFFPVTVGYRRLRLVKVAR